MWLCPTNPLPFFSSASGGAAKASPAVVSAAIDFRWPDMADDKVRLPIRPQIWLSWWIPSFLFFFLCWLGLWAGEGGCGSDNLYGVFFVCVCGVGGGWGVWIRRLVGMMTGGEGTSIVACGGLGLFLVLILSWLVRCEGAVLFAVWADFLYWWCFFYFFSFWKKKVSQFVIHPPLLLFLKNLIEKLLFDWRKSFTFYGAVIDEFFVDD